MTTATASQPTITTRIGQAGNLGKHAPAAAMVRLVREMEDMLGEAGIIGGPDHDRISNILNAFLGKLPAKVAEEVRHG